MTVKELSEAVKNLVGEYDYFDNDAFFASANIALGNIFSETDCTGRASVYLSSPKVLQHIPRLRHSSGSAEEVKLLGAAYSMRLFGRGNVIINDGQNSVNHEFNAWGSVLKGRVLSEGYVRFCGEFAYTVKDITLFSEIEGSSDDDIPVLGDKRSVRIESFVPDYSRALCAPTDENGAPLCSVSIENGYICCPKNFTGEVRFSYKKRPPKLCSELEGMEIPIPAEAESALALLTSAYLLGEAESDAAEFFLKAYKRCISRISSNNMPSESGRYFDTTGWA